MSGAVDAVQDFTTGLFDFATSPFRAIGSALFPRQGPIPQPPPTATPGISRVQGRRDQLRREQGRQGRASLILSRRSPSNNTGMRPMGSTTIGGGVES